MYLCMFVAIQLEEFATFRECECSKEKQNKLKLQREETDSKNTRLCETITKQQGFLFSN